MDMEIIPDYVEYEAHTQVPEWKIAVKAALVSISYV